MLRRGIAASALLSVAGTVSAASTFLPYVRSETTYDTNVFRLADGEQAPLIDGERRKADVMFANTLGVNASTSWQQQRLYVRAEGGRIDYLNLSSLDQNVYDVGGGLDWTVFSRVNGTVKGNIVRSQGNYADRDVAVVNRSRASNVGGSFNFLLTNDVRFDTGYTRQQLRTPVLGAPGFQLKQGTSTTSLKYVGIKRLSAGIVGTYVDGGYTGTQDESKFKQYAGSVTANYAFSDISQGTATLGYTTRDNRGLLPNSDGKVNGLTGSLDYQRELTGKTRASVRLARDIYAYDAGENATIATGLQLQTVWNATDKINVALGYSLQHVKFNQGANVNPVFLNRRDLQHEVDLAMTYQVIRWLAIKPKFGYELRDSNRGLSGYDTLLYGLQLEGAWQ